MSNDPYTHVYHRIAERVSRDHNVDVDATDVENLLRDHARRPMREDIEKAITDEATEYGLEF